MSERGIDVDVAALDEDEVPTPAQPWEVAKRCIREACPADGHDWVDLTGLDPTGYWRECRTCGIADVTAQALGQGVETPNDHREGSDG